MPMYDLGILSTIAVPLISAGKCFGMLALGSRESQAYTEQDLAAAKRVGAQIAGAIANARLHSDVQRSEELSRRLSRENEVLAEIGRTITASMEIDEVYSDFGEQVRELIPYDWIDIATVDRKREKVRVEYMYGLPKDAVTAQPGYTRPFAGSILEEVLRSGTGILSVPRDRDELARELPAFVPAFDLESVSQVTVPLAGSGKVIGMLAISSSKPQAYTMDDLHMAERIANQISGHFSNARMFAEQRRAEEALRDSEEHFRAVTESATDAIVSADHDGKIILWNAAAHELFGFQQEEVIGKPIQMIMPDRYRQRHLEGFRQAAMGSRSSLIGTVSEMEGLRKDGIEFPIELSLSNWRARGEWFFTAIIRDITERKQAELKAHELALLPQLNPAPLLRFDSRGVIVTANPAAVAILGALEGDSMLLEAVLPVMNDIDLEELVHQGLQTTREATIGTRQFEFVILGNADSAMGHAYGFEITERKELQAQLIQSQKMEVVGQLAGGVAHDFNNLLTGILGFASISKEKLPPNHPVSSYLAEIQTAAERAAAITRQLLTFSRREMVETKVIELNGIIFGTVGMLRRLIGENIELVTLPLLNPAMVRVDPGQIEQVLINLVVNARDAMPEGGKLTIVVAGATIGSDRVDHLADLNPGNYVRFSVKDAGIGMDENVLSHLFEPFYTTKEQGKGTGLGLATCYGIIRECGGDIHVWSEVGQGSTFEVYLPQVEDTLAVLKEGGDSRTASEGTETVLLVEDDPSVRLLASLVLRQQGYAVLEASNGEEALRVVRQHGGENIQLLLTDIVMPKMGGRELVDRLLAQFPETRVIYTSGYPEGALTQHSGPTDGILVLQKPYAPEIIAEKVREVLDTPPSD
jgi:two-component system cell cycle sensor histidine kinase/response regulator CckA